MIISTVPASNCTPQTIVIGRRGTYDTMQIAFDLTYLVENYGSGTAVLAIKRSQDESAYPAVVTQEDNTLTWTITETDTYYVGSGECQLMWYVDGGLAKSIIYPMVVMRDILSTTEEAPDAYQTWVDDLTALGAETLQHAQAAAESAADAEAAQTAAETAADRAEDALEEFTTPTASATSLAPEAQATAAYSEGHFTFGIPRGAQGATGATPDFEIGTVETLEPDQPATATITGTPENPVLNLGIPKGEKGEGGGGAVESVNGKTGVVVLTASDVGAGTYSKPSGGIPKTDLDAAVQTSLGKADTALQTAPVSSVAGKTGAVTLDAGNAAFSDSATYAAGTVGAALSAQKNAISQLGNVAAFKTAILQLAQKVAYIDEYGQDYYDDLYDALYPPVPLASISAVFVQGSTVIYDTESLDDLKPMLTVTATYEDQTTEVVTNYTLSGTLTVGTSVITVSYRDKTTTFNVVVTEANIFDPTTAGKNDLFVNTSTNTIVQSSVTQYKSAFIPISPSTTYEIDKDVSGQFRVATTIEEPALNVAITKTQANHSGSSITILSGANDNWLFITYWANATSSSYDPDLILNSIKVYPS